MVQGKIVLLCLINLLCVVNVNSNKIIGGNEVDPYSYPFVAALVHRPSFFHICGASLISPTTALTAAHCVHMGDSFDLYFHRHNESVHPLFEGSILRQVQRVIIHPEHIYLDYDYALLQWDRPITTIK